MPLVSQNSIREKKHKQGCVSNQLHWASYSTTTFHIFLSTEIMIATISHTEQESLISLLGKCQHDSIPLSLSDETISSGVFGWSDIPCQSDHYLDENDDSNFDLSMFQAISYSPYNPATVITPVVSCRNASVVASFTSQQQRRRKLVGTSKLNNKKPLHERSRSTETIAVNEVRSKKSKKTSNKSAQFANEVQIREYNIVVSEHPCCASGMALECGWDYNDNHVIVDMLDLDAPSHVRRTSRRPECFRLSYYARRERLQEVTGMSGQHLLQEEFRIVFGDKYDNESIAALSKGSDTICVRKIQSIHHTSSFATLNIQQQ